MMTEAEMREMGLRRAQLDLRTAQLRWWDERLAAMGTLPGKSPPMDAETFAQSPLGKVKESRFKPHE